MLQLEEVKDERRQKEAEQVQVQNKLMDDCRRLHQQVEELTLKIHSLESVIESKTLLNEQLVRLLSETFSHSS